MEYSSGKYEKTFLWLEHQSVGFGLYLSRLTWAGWAVPGAVLALLGLTHSQGSSGGRSWAGEWDHDSNKGKQYLSCRQGLMSKQDLIKDKASNLNFSGCLLISFFASSPSHRATHSNEKCQNLGELELWLFGWGSFSKLYCSCLSYPKVFKQKYTHTP